MDESVLAHLVVRCLTKQAAAQYLGIASAQALNCLG